MREFHDVKANSGIGFEIERAGVPSFAGPAKNEIFDFP
jgi:hypothetical protein